MQPTLIFGCVKALDLFFLDAASDGASQRRAADLLYFSDAGSVGYVADLFFSDAGSVGHELLMIAQRR